MATKKFRKAQRSQALLRLLLTGPSGSGKTFSALVIAEFIAAQTKSKIAYIDTENSSSELYSHRFDFDVLNLEPPFEPERYIEAIEAAEAEGYRVVVVDSASHEWAGPGGILDTIDNLKKTSKNKMDPWAAMTPRHNAFVDKLLRTKGHLVACARSKTAWQLPDQPGGKVKKLGTAPITREGLEYEFTTALDLTVEDNLATISKDRTTDVWPRDPFRIQAAHVERLWAWLTTGIDRDAELQEAIAKTRKALKSAPNVEELRQRFIGATEIGRQMRSQEFLDAAIEAKNERKAELEILDGGNEPASGQEATEEETR